MAEQNFDFVSRKERRLRDHFEILKERFERLPETDRNLFRTGSIFLALNSSFCGLIANNYVRSALNITQARVASALPMVVLPFTTTLVVYEAVVSQPLMQGDLNCATCVSVRGGLVGAVMGCVLPAVSAIPLNGALATRYSTAPLPSKENLFRFWMAVCKPAFRKLRFAAILQAALGTYLGTKHYDIYIKMLQMPESGKDPEELSE